MYLLTGFSPVAYGGTLNNGLGGVFTFGTGDYERSIDETQAFQFSPLSNISSSPINQIGYYPYRQMSPVTIKWSHLASSLADADENSRKVKYNLSAGLTWIKANSLNGTTVQQRFVPTSVKATPRWGKKYKIMDYEVQGYKHANWLGQTVRTVVASNNPGVTNIANISTLLSAYNMDGLCFDMQINIASTSNFYHFQLYNCLPYGTPLDYFHNVLPSDTASGYNYNSLWNTMHWWEALNYNYNGTSMYGLTQQFYFGGVSANFERNVKRYSNPSSYYYPCGPLFFISPTSRHQMNITTDVTNSFSATVLFREVFI